MNCDTDLNNKSKSCEINLYKLLGSGMTGLMLKKGDFKYSTLLHVHTSVEIGIGGILNDEQVRNLRDFLNMILNDQ